MTTVRIGTFNCENLFARFRFQSNVKPENAVKDGWDVNQTAFDVLNATEKKLTAAAIKAMKADVVALQEVENLEVLRRFRNDFLGGSKSFPHSILIDGPDPRRIDVAVLSKFPIVHARSYQHLGVFSRDCLEVDLDVGGGKALTLFVQHFKSMLDKEHPCEGRKRTRDRRADQAAAVKKIVKDRFGAQAGKKPFVVLGDFNDYREADQGTTSAIKSLVDWDQIEDVIGRLPGAERWTHYWEGNKKCHLPEAYRQLDYLLLSKSLANVSNALPELVRKGLTPKATQAGTSRFAGVTAKTVASDHCPVVMGIAV
ncbi:MAG: endonuclease/exonuclease/phosphatase family protein [Planctomycetes bacterium]|nr:endonuclease/exonuclease/phosphatase family protein [Planctomycetota bacterium]